MYLNIEYRDGNKEQKCVDDCTIKSECLMYYIRWGKDAGTHYIPLLKSLTKRVEDLREKERRHMYDCEKST